MFLLAVLACLLVPINPSPTSSKKGVCVPPGHGRYQCGDLQALTRVSWWYNWHVEPNDNDEGWPCGTRQPAFVPMI